jgi:hypothetical protein
MIIILRRYYNKVVSENAQSFTSEHLMSQNYNKENFRCTVKSLRGMTERLQYSKIMEIF